MSPVLSATPGAGAEPAAQRAPRPLAAPRGLGASVPLPRYIMKFDCGVIFVGYNCIISIYVYVCIAKSIAVGNRNVPSEHQESSRARLVFRKCKSNWPGACVPCFAVCVEL